MFKPAHSNRTPTISASAQKIRFTYSKYPIVLGLYSTTLPSAVGFRNGVYTDDHNLISLPDFLYSLLPHSGLAALPLWLSGTRSCASLGTLFQCE